MSSYKLLGVIIGEDLKWHHQVDCIIVNSSKRHYALRLLKRAGVVPQDILQIYRSNVRSTLEYALQVWHSIPEYLSERIENIQKRPLKIIYPCCTYSEALTLANISTLASRRKSLCRKFISDMSNNSDHPILFLLPS